MNKKIFVLSILCLLVFTGCGSPKNELDKFKLYLKKNGDFKCVENICTSKREVGQLMTFNNEIDFDRKTYTDLNEGTNGRYTRKTIYNWGTNISTYYYSTLGVEINATYNHNTDDFSCNSQDTDRDFVNNECNNAKNIISSYKVDFEKMITESGTLYFSE